MADTFTLVVAPKHKIVPLATALAFNAVGSVIVTDVDVEHPFASDTVNDHVPAARVNVPVPEYGAVPPVAETVTVDVPPLQSIGVADDDATTAVGSVIVIVVDAEQLFASVTVNEYVPAVLVNVPVPEYGAVPPVADTVTVAEPPLHTIADDDDDAITGVVSVTTTEAVAVQLFASVTATIYVPLLDAVMLCDVAPVFHKYETPADEFNTTLPPSQNVVGPAGEIDAVQPLQFVT